MISEKDKKQMEECKRHLGDLPRFGLFNFDLLSKVKKIALAVSGGVDSMSLLHHVYLLKKFEVYKGDFFVINFDHQLRGDDSTRDSLFVEEFCKLFNIKCIKIDLDVTNYAKGNKKSIESAARELRRLEYKRIVDEKIAQRVLTAHNMDDQIESILMHIFRGCGNNGLIGMLEDDGLILRCMLNISKREIEDYVKEHKIPFTKDYTNEESEFSRNYLRNVVIPKIRERYPNFENAILNLSESATNIQNLLDEKSKGMSYREGDKSFICIETLKKQPKAIAMNVISIALKEAGILVDIESKHYKSIYELASKETGKSINLPMGYIAAVEYGKIAIYKPKAREKEDEEAILFSPGNFEIGDTKFSVTYAKKLGSNGQYLDGDKIPSDAVFRRAKRGDKFKRFSSGTKNLSKFLIDRKVSREERKEIVVLASESRVLLVVGHEIAEDVKIDINTKNIINVIRR